MRVTDKDLLGTRTTHVKTHCLEQFQCVHMQGLFQACVGCSLSIGAKGIPERREADDRCAIAHSSFPGIPMFAAPDVS